MILTDTHTHLYLPEFKDDSTGAVRRAIDAGVEKMMLPNVDNTTISAMKELREQFPNNLFMAMGLHPTSVGEDREEEMSIIKKELETGDYKAIGEIGIDLYWDKKFREEQMIIFDQQLSIAEEMNLPVIIHCREALDETLEVMESHKNLTGVFHSFGGSREDVRKIRRRAGDFYFGINGIVTFKNSGLRETLPEIEIDRILLETDSPYLSPVPHRGKRCESAYIIHTANHVAQALNISPDETAQKTTESAIKLFSI